MSDADGCAVSVLDEHLARLRALPAHGNRVLHYDQLLVGLLLSFFDPTVRSLRLIEHCGDFGGRLDLDRMARSTTADALKVFDPVHLKPVIADLQRRAGRVRGRDGDASLQGILRRIVAADGTYINTLADVAWALRQRGSDGRPQGRVRLDVQLGVADWTPQVVNVSGKEDGHEPAAVAKDLLSGVLYVVDRNFLDFAFLKLLLARDNDFVLRVRDNAPATRTVRTLPITPEDAAAAGVASDEVVTLTGRDAPQGEFRLVAIRTTNRQGKAEVIRLLSSLTDGELVAARTVGEVYRQRWQIELFFKWLKTWANLDHLLSTSRGGITFQFYVAVIGVLLTYVRLGRRVSRYAIALLHRVLHGQLTVDQMMRSLARLEREKERARERAAARRRAAKKLA